MVRTYIVGRIRNTCLHHEEQRFFGALNRDDSRNFTQITVYFIFPTKNPCNKESKIECFLPSSFDGGQTKFTEHLNRFSESRPHFVLPHTLLPLHKRNEECSKPQSATLQSHIRLGSTFFSEKKEKKIENDAAAALCKHPLIHPPE